MRFRQRETAQDVVVCCCILHNMRKVLDAKPKKYSEFELEYQNQLSENFLNNPRARFVNLQQYIIDNLII